MLKHYSPLIAAFLSQSHAVPRHVSWAPTFLSSLSGSLQSNCVIKTWIKWAIKSPLIAKLLPPGQTKMTVSPFVQQLLTFLQRHFFFSNRVVLTRLWFRLLWSSEFVSKRAPSLNGVWLQLFPTWRFLIQENDWQKTLYTEKTNL